MKIMVNKKFVLSEEEAKDLIWSEIMMEEEDNFTPDFKSNIYRIIKQIREEI